MPVAPPKIARLNVYHRIVSKDCLIRINNKFYKLPDAYACKDAQVYESETTISVSYPKLESVEFDKAKGIYYAGKRFLGLECVTTKILCNFSVLHSFAFKKAFYKLFVISFCFHVLIDKIYQLVRVHCFLMTYIRLQCIIKQFNSI